MDAIALSSPAHTEVRRSDARARGTSLAFTGAVLLTFVGMVLAPLYTPPPWWGLLWIGPVLYASHRAWRLGRGWSRSWALAPLIALGVIGHFDLDLPWPWWAGHATIAVILLLSTVSMRPLRSAFGLEFLVLMAVVGLRPWVGVGRLDRFWFDCVRLRPGITIEQVLGELDGYYVQDARTNDGCVHLRVHDLSGHERSDYVESYERDGRQGEKVILYPNDGADCDADGCWTWFVDGRLDDVWLSPD